MQVCHSLLFPSGSHYQSAARVTNNTCSEVPICVNQSTGPQETKKSLSTTVRTSCQFHSLMPVLLIDPGRGEAQEEGVWEERREIGGVRMVGGVLLSLDNCSHRLCTSIL